MLNNLVENALKFTGVGKLVKRYRREADSAIFVVEDQGCGIPEDEQERVFEQLYQVERARSGSARPEPVAASPSCVIAR
ncbi:MAG: HAMP domain-containing sensor histidine kinase [Marinagarivorans sp.]|nr:HAMP domain-containing sensor histidine kinase [Marinagarivorans sp.]